MSEGSAPTPGPTPAPPPYRYRRGGYCNCARCRCRSLMAPVILITLGVLFMVDQFVPGVGFRDLWPLLLIAIGVLKLAEYSASMAGHRG